MWSLRDWRRRRLLQRSRIPEAIWRRVREGTPALQRLADTEARRLRALAILFLHEKAIEAAAGLVLDEEMRLRIAAQAVLPILNLGLDYYRGWLSVIVYPGAFVAPHEVIDEAGVVHNVRRPLVGESWDKGPVILSWEDVEAAGDGRNVVIHECAHKLDTLNGMANGLPPLHGDMSVAVWSRVFSVAFADFCERVGRRERTIIDPYAAESPAEFFAVMSEIFFGLPGELQASYPEVYEQLRAFYRQDPGQRLP